MLPNLLMVRTFLPNFYIIPFLFVYHGPPGIAFGNFRPWDSEGRRRRRQGVTGSLLRPEPLDFPFHRRIVRRSLTNILIRFPANSHPTSIFRLSALNEQFHQHSGPDVPPIVPPVHPTPGASMGFTPDVDGTMFYNPHQLHESADSWADHWKNLSVALEQTKPKTDY